MGKIIIGKVAFTPQGAYDSSVTYAKYDMVYEYLTVFISLQDNNTAPLSDATAWKVLMGIDKVLGRMLADGAITTDKIGAGEVKSVNIGQGEVKSANIADGAVTNAKIGAGEVKSGHIGDGEVKSANIADGAVQIGKIADGAVTSEKIASGSVDSSKIADDAVEARHIAEETLTRDKFAPGAIDNIYSIFRELVDEFEPTVIHGPVENAPDEEDLTEKNGLLKFRDRLPLYGLGRKILRRHLVDVYPDDVWAFKKVGDVVYLLYTVDNVWYGVYDSATGKGLGLANNLVTEIADYDVNALPDLSQGHYLSYTTENNVHTITLPNGDTITSTALNNHEIFRFDDVEPEQRNDYLSSNDFPDENTVYVVQYDFSMAGRTVRIPLGCAILFDGGHLSDGTLECNGTRLVSELYYDYMTDVTLTGSYQDETAKSLQDQINAIVNDKATVKLTASPSVIFVGDARDITLQATTNTSASSIMVKKGTEVLGEGSGTALSASDSQLTLSAAGVVTYVADFVISGLSKSTQATVQAVDKIYYGIGTEDSYADITTYQSARVNANGDYPFTPTAEKKYVYILQPYAMAAINLDHIFLGKLGYNMQLVSDNITKDGVRYRVYRSVGDNQAVSFTLTIN